MPWGNYKRPFHNFHIFFPALDIVLAPKTGDENDRHVLRANPDHYIITCLIIVTYYCACLSFLHLSQGLLKRHLKVIILSLQPLSVIAVYCCTVLFPKVATARRKSIRKNNLKREKQDYSNCKKLNRN